jgi:hypothetical protein
MPYPNVSTYFLQELELPWPTYGQQVLNSTVGVEKRSAHSPINVCPRETHALHVGDCGIALRTHGQRRRIVEVPGISRLLSRSW